MTYTSISIIGMGYIGLPTAAVFASRKVRVTGVDVNAEVVNTINNGDIHIVEPDLDIIVRSCVTEGFLKATTEPEPAEAFIIAVPTPFKGRDHEPDLAYIEQSTRAIAPVLKRGNLIVLESTSPVGTTEKISEWLCEERPDLSFPHTHGEVSDIRIAHCPERVLPGHIMRELVENDRVIGGLTDACSQAAITLYKTFVQGKCFVTNARTAEMAKLTENSFRDVNIAFANELSVICDELDINVWDLITLANRHPRVNILKPGPGVGGHCIAVDPWFIVSRTPKAARVIHTARIVNDDKPSWVIEKVREAIGTCLIEDSRATASDITLACYGLAFKPDIDDLRESPALLIVEQLAKCKSFQLLVVEPNIKNLPASLDGAELVTIDEAFTQADIHVLLVGHKEFHEAGQPVKGRLLDVTGIWTASRALRKNG